MDQSHDVVFRFMSDAELAAYQAELAAEEAKLKLNKAAFMSEVRHRFADQIKEAYDQAGKTFGSVSFLAGDPEQPIDVDVTIPKKVEWNETELMAYLNSLPRAIAQRIGKFSVKVGETHFKNAPEEVRAELKKMRTEKRGTVSITFGKLD